MVTIGLKIFDALHDRLASRFPCFTTLAEEEVDESVWSGPLRDLFGHRAGALSIRYSAVKEVLPFVIECAGELGLCVFDGQTKLIHRADGIAGLALTVENRRVLRGPTISQVNEAVDAMTPRGGPGFLILEGPGEDYAQTAGGDGTFTAEWREHSGNTFRHWVAGYRDRPIGATEAIPTNGSQVTVKENEVLRADDVKAILLAFAHQKVKPDGYAWREITAEFQKA